MLQLALHETSGSSKCGVPDQHQYAGLSSLSPFIVLSGILLTYGKWADLGTALETGFHAAGQPLQAGANPV